VNIKIGLGSAAKKKGKEVMFRSPGERRGNEKVKPARKEKGREKKDRTLPTKE